MERKIQKPAFLILLFILFFTLLNMFIIPITNYNTFRSSFIIVFSFWAFMILVLFIISHFLADEKGEGDV